MMDLYYFHGFNMKEIGEMFGGHAEPFVSIVLKRGRQACLDQGKNITKSSKINKVLFQVLSETVEEYEESMEEIKVGV